MRRREMLEFAVLGLLHESPMHGYELRRQLNSRLGAFRALSFGTLYPCLARLQSQGLVSPTQDSAGRATGRRQRITYRLTDEGRAAFADRVDRVDPGSWEDDAFDVRVAFFARTEREVRLRILEGRRARLVERMAVMREDRAGLGVIDSWTAALHAHGEDEAMAAVRWLDELIAAERSGPSSRPGTLTDPNHPAFNPPDQSGSKENP